MQFKFTFKHLEALDSIKDYAQNRVDKVEKFSLRKPSRSHFIFSVQKQDQVAELIVDAGPVHFTAVAKDESLYTAIDKVVDKMQRQLSKRKEKIQNHKHYDA